MAYIKDHYIVRRRIDREKYPELMVPELPDLDYRMHRSPAPADSDLETTEGR